MMPPQHADARIAHGRQRVQPVLVLARADHILVVLGRGIEIVVVVVETRIAQRCRLVRLQHAQRGTGLHAQSLHGTDQLVHLLDIAVLGARQAAPMQKRVAPASWAALAARVTSSTLISFSAFTPVSNSADCGQ